MVLLLALFACRPDDDCLSPVVARVDFGDVQAGVPVLRRVGFDARCDVTVTASVEGDGFTLLTDEIALSAGEGGGFDVSFAPSTYGEHVGTLTIGDREVELTGAMRADQDGDGHDAVDAGGDDCDDLDASAFTGATEERDLADDDCDGLADEDFVHPGDVWPSEVMTRPSVGDRGQWIELHNATPEPLNVGGWTLETGAGAWALPDVAIPAFGYRVIAAAGAAENGGVSADAIWDGLTLADDVDSVSLRMGDTEIARVAWDAGWPLEDGASLAADVFASGGVLADPKYWCAADRTLPSGDRGSPGGPNDRCPTVDHDADGITEADGDCDDTDGAVAPFRTELWNGVDDDCDGRTDDLTLEFAPRAHLVGAAGDWLGTDGFALGDVDGDGVDELAIGSGVGSDGRGVVLLVDPTDWRGWSEAAARDVAEIVVAPADAWALGKLPAALRDHTGDGVADLLVAGMDDGSGTPGWALWPGPVGAAPDLAGATIGTGFGVYAAPAIAAPDLDGDGVAEVVYGVAAGRDAVYVFRPGDGDLDDADADARIDGVADERFGETLVSADLDADGYEDLLIGAASNDDHGPDTGTVWIVPGPVDGEVPAADAAILQVRGQHPFGRLGEADSIAVGDFRGDGALDLAVGAPGTSEVYFFHDIGGRSGVLDGGAFEGLIASSALTSLGRTVVAGDVDDDGLDELLVGSIAGGYGPALFVFDDLSRRSLEPEVDASAQIYAAASEQPAPARVLDVDHDGESETVIAVPAWAAGEGTAWVLQEESP